MADYPDFVETCGYGNGAGILGWNCRHSFFPYIEGVSERTFTDAELEDMKPENRPKTEFGWREYDDYQATQFMRAMERELRRLKRELTGRDAAELDSTETGARIKALQEQYTQFSEASGIPKQPDRTSVYREKILDGMGGGA